MHPPRFLFTLLLALVGNSILESADTTTPVKGLHTYTPRISAITHATVVTAPGKVIEDATVVLRDGLIESVGTGIAVPPDARVWNMEGKTVYAGFIDAYSQYGMPEGLKTFQPGGEEEGPPRKMPPTPDSMGASAWNPVVTPERDAADYFKPNKKAAEVLSDAGFTTAATYPARGIFRGQGLLVNINGKPVSEAAVKTELAQHISFDRWQDSQTHRPNDGDTYPVSTMGSIALTRQTLYDAQWHKTVTNGYAKDPRKVEKPEQNDALAALHSLVEGKQWALFNADDELGYERIAKVAEEFKLDFAILGNGYEYRRTDILKKLGKTVVLPLSFPGTPEVERPDKALGLSLEQLQHWELAPSNAAFLSRAGVSFCFTSHFNSGDSFWKSVRESVKRGLSEAAALSALTTTPAALCRIDNRLGTVEAGKIANLTIATGNLFSDEKARISEIWIDGEYIEKKPAGKIDLSGTWEFSWTGVIGFQVAEITSDGDKQTLTFGKQTIQLSAQTNEVLLFTPSSSLGFADMEGPASLQAYYTDDRLSGSGQLPDGTTFNWLAHRTGNASQAMDKSEEADEEESDPSEFAFDRYPAGVYGVEKQDTPTLVLIKNATLWTCGPDGILQKTDMLVRNGKIAEIGTRLKAPSDAEVIDAAGKYVTPGLIDCHSHIAGTGGINEGGSAISVEVRIGDILNPADINIYRQLAGGLTTSNILHGSANPMGGQSQVIKLRWGMSAEELKFEGAKPSVKFALGENVKRSRDPNSTRYPYSRLGVEQFFVNYFRAAEDYERTWNEYKQSKSSTPPRTDLRLAAVLEILRRERAVHIHSYRQDEILMFARLAGKLNLEVAAFQHILEGYKVADALADINAGGSSFTDWWAYKYEVIDAIPYNGALMHRAGVLTSFNSDDAELATRLNTEAAKAVKYGGLTEEEALKFVTINPAKQLRIDHRVGSLEIGKDADFVVWSDHPLSTFAHAEQSWIDGQKFFDIDESKAQYEVDTRERQRLVQKGLKERLREMKLGGKDAANGKAPPDDSGHDENPEWLYHDGGNLYSCSAETEGGHL